MKNYELIQLLKDKKAGLNITISCNIAIERLKELLKDAKDNDCYSNTITLNLTGNIEDEDDQDILLESIE